MRRRGLTGMEGIKGIRRRGLQGWKDKRDGEKKERGCYRKIILKSDMNPLVFLIKSPYTMRLNV
jgi:methionine salvage enolase-phosphatase E1